MSQPNHPTSNRRRHFRISPEARAQRAEALEKERLERIDKEAAEESTDQMLRYYRSNGITPSVPFSENISRHPSRFHFRGERSAIEDLAIDPQRFYQGGQRSFIDDIQPSQRPHQSRDIERSETKARQAIERARRRKFRELMEIEEAEGDPKLLDFFNRRAMDEMEEPWSRERIKNEEQSVLDQLLGTADDSYRNALPYQHQFEEALQRQNIKNEADLGALGIKENFHRDLSLGENAYKKSLRDALSNETFLQDSGTLEDLWDQPAGQILRDPQTGRGYHQSSIPGLQKRLYSTEEPYFEAGTPQYTGVPSDTILRAERATLADPSLFIHDIDMVGSTPEKQADVNNYLDGYPDVLTNNPSDPQDLMNLIGIDMEAINNNTRVKTLANGVERHITTREAQTPVNYDFQDPMTRDTVDYNTLFRDMPAESIAQYLR